MILKFLCNVVYYTVLCVMAIPIILYTIIAEIRIGSTKHPDRFKHPLSISLNHDLSRIHYQTYVRIHTLTWGTGKVSKVFKYIRRLRGETP